MHGRKKVDALCQPTQPHKAKPQNNCKIFYGHAGAPVENHYNTVRGVNYQLLALMLGLMGIYATSSSRPQRTTDNGVRDANKSIVYKSVQIKCVVRGFDPGTFGILGHCNAYAANHGGRIGSERKRKQWKTKMERAAQANKGALTLPLNPPNHKRSNTLSTR